jgi:hypothetical protein
MKSQPQQPLLVAVGANGVLNVQERCGEQFAILEDANRACLFQDEKPIVKGMGARLMLLTGFSGIGVLVGVGGISVGGASVAAGWVGAASSLMTGGGGGVLVAGTAVLITGEARVGFVDTADSSGSSLWQAAKVSRTSVKTRTNNLRIRFLIIKPFAWGRWGSEAKGWSVN